MSTTVSRIREVIEEVRIEPLLPLFLSFANAQKFNRIIQRKSSQDRYLSLSTVYDEEHSQLTSRKEEIESLLTEIETSKGNIQFFTQLIEKYSDIQELNARILNELIEKIVVSEKEIIDGEKYQCVHIYYKFVGLMSI